MVRQHRKLDHRVVRNIKERKEMMNSNRTRDAPENFEIIFETLTRFCKIFPTVYMKAQENAFCSLTIE